MTNPKLTTVRARLLALPLLLAPALLGAAAHALPQDEPAQPPQRQRGGADPSDDAFEMGSPPALPDGMTEEEMWPAATEDGWKRPCLVHWQRTFDDALKVARAEGRPIMVAVNMDGEIASEHFAGVRYRQEETAALMHAYVPVIASVYRHTPRDYDENGRRVECPRFGTVTCGEHIENERRLYDQYFEGTRVAPRHIVLTPRGEKTSDVYYAWDTATVVRSFVENAKGWPPPGDPVERPLADLARSADVADREVLERTYVTGERAVRREILTTLLDARVVDQVELLRAAIFGLDLELARMARRALARCETEGALDLMAEVLKSPLEADEREMILAAVRRMAATSTRARTLAALHSGLSAGSRHVDTAALDASVREYEASARADLAASARAAEAEPDSPERHLELAEALMGRALGDRSSRFAELWLEDARRELAEAERLGASGPLADALAAVAAEERGDSTAARARALAAVEAGLLGADASEAGLDPLLAGRVLRLFADARRAAIRAAYRAGEEWPPEWLSDVNAAHTALLEGPLADEGLLVEHLDFLRWIGATRRANEVLDDALARYPDSALLHERLRARLLWEGGPAGLEQAYAQRLARATEEGVETQLEWYAGYAALVAAEHQRRRGRQDEALAAYARGIELYRRQAERTPETAESCRHFVAMAHAGRARAALESGDLALATGELLEALRGSPASAATADGLGLTAVATARMLQARLRAAGDAGAAESVGTALDALDPALLEPPPSELPGGRRGGPPRGR